MNFLRSFFASVLGTLTAIGFAFAILLFIFSATASLLNAPSANRPLKSSSILSLDLKLPLVERPPVFDEIQQFLGIDEEVIALPDVLSAIRTASTDPNVEGIRLRSDFVTAGWSQAHSIRKALKKFKSTGKFIYAYGDFFTQKGYFVASVADSIFLKPAGAFEFKGLASEVLYYKDFQDTYGFKMEVVRHGKYKSAVEPFLENEMSAENEYQISSLLNDLWSTVREEVSSDRGFTPEALDALINDNTPSLPEEALEAKLIDGLYYEDTFDEKIKLRLEMDLEDELKLVSQNRVNASNASYDSTIKDRIGVVFANGPILYGEGTESIIAQGVFVETLEDLAQDDWIKAVVLRINSPGGSALISELLWRAVEKVKESKPVIVSIGNTAASGGYYIASGADAIFADPMSITGSIGVFATLPNATDFLKDIGIQAQTVETHPNALGYSPYQPLTPAFKKQLEKGIEKTYTQFKQRVEQGRSLDPEVVENVAQGRVWTGKQALELGLVDRLGGLEDAIAEAAVCAGIETYNTLEYPKFEESLESMLKGISPSIELQNPIENWIPKDVLLSFKNFKTKTPSPYIQTLMPFELKIH